MESLLERIFQDCDTKRNLIFEKAKKKIDDCFIEILNKVNEERKLLLQKVDKAIEKRRNSSEKLKSEISSHLTNIR